MNIIVSKKKLCNFCRAIECNDHRCGVAKQQYLERCGISVGSDVQQNNFLNLKRGDFIYMIDHAPLIPEIVISKVVDRPDNLISDGNGLCIYVTYLGADLDRVIIPHDNTGEKSCYIEAQDFSVFISVGDARDGLKKLLQERIESLKERLEEV